MHIFVVWADPILFSGGYERTGRWEGVSGVAAVFFTEAVGVAMGVHQTRLTGLGARRHNYLVEAPRFTGHIFYFWRPKIFWLDVVD